MSFTALLKSLHAAPNVSPHDIHNAISAAVMDGIADDWQKSANPDATSDKKAESARRAFYLSMEFLMGRAVYNNLLCLGLTEEVKKAFEEIGADFSVMEDAEDAALGNGGLGRLAACFLDSAAALGLPLDGYGIRYKYGLFKQSFENGFQKEEADDWTKYGDPWSVRREEDAVELIYADMTVKAVPYDMPIIGRGTENIRTLRLWQAEPVEEFDFAVFDRGEYLKASESAVLAQNISRCLYPNDSTYEGLKLRFRQEYFFSAASMRDIIKNHKQNGRNIKELPDFVSIQLNDTHPVVSIPEIIRILIDEEGLEFSEALDISRKIFNYTNHTIMAEALEKWNTGLVQELLPRIYEICLQINEAFIAEMYARGFSTEKINELRIIAGENPSTLHMARMAVYCSAAVNGVAELHTEILKTSVLKDWYGLYPDKFQNKTNGITPRRWLKLCNPKLSGLITELLGDSEWAYDLDRLKELRKYANDKGVINRFAEIKHQNKKELADYIQKSEGITINPDSIFDIQVKRLHEYKRQLLNAFSVLYLYFGIKDGRYKDFHPTTFIFGAKSAPAYARAKGIIKYINEISALIERDKDVRELIKVVFVQNYNVSYAERLVSAADVSEQISPAGTEASGTGNMKFMLNGTVTLGTMDGANIEIVEEAGAENNYIFGADAEGLKKIMPDYEPRKIVATDKQIDRVLHTLIDGIFHVNHGSQVNNDATDIFRELYFSLLDGASWHVPDHYYLLGDFNSYVNAKLLINADYRDKREEFHKKCWLNMASAGKFSSDRTIKDYAENIWRIK
ncbi:MAG: glycogen/starch/alpha-glucan phosphorylase [Oscillospiraceae bacterium]|nr:glycogen/starch/alpha-glucan phosphorylase [Oscillospiraceae bacterium]